MWYLMDVTLSNQIVENKDPKDKTDKVLAEIEKWKKLRIKGSLTLYFDGSGRVPRYTCTLEGQ